MGRIVKLSGGMVMDAEDPETTAHLQQMWDKFWKGEAKLKLVPIPVAALSVVVPGL